MLYVHIPFCERKCNYCDFVSFHANEDVIKNYITKLVSEIKNKSYLASDYEIKSIYIGGGTPSVINEKHIVTILSDIMKYYKLCDDIEISIEVNPNSATKEKLQEYFNIGINRISIGLQSANDDELKTLGRIHTYNDFLNAYNESLHVGFKNINIDLINGIPNQTPESYKKTLKQVLMLSTKHISIYNLIIEDNTPFKQMLENGTIILPNESEILKMDEITKELTEYYRLYRYEISNYAKENYECRHNLGYWSDVPYLGFGLNAASYINNTRLKNKVNINEYMKQDFDKYLSSNKLNDYYDEISYIYKEEHIREYVMLGFRKTAGINIDDFFNTFNIDFENLYRSQIKYYQSMELLYKNKNNYYLSDRGLDISNKIISDFIN